MGLYKLDQAVIADCLALISAQTLTIRADQAARVAQLQQTLAEARPVADREGDYAELLELWKREGELARELDSKVESVTAERDAARELAVTLEQKIAQLTDRLERAQQLANKE